MRDQLLRLVGITALIAAGCESSSSGSPQANSKVSAPAAVHSQKAFVSGLQSLARNIGGVGYTESFDDGVRYTRQRDDWEVTWALRYHADPPTPFLQVQRMDWEESDRWMELLVEEAAWQELFLNQQGAEELRTWIQARGQEMQSNWPVMTVERTVINGWPFELTLQSADENPDSHICRATLRWSNRLLLRPVAPARLLSPIASSERTPFQLQD